MFVPSLEEWILKQKIYKPIQAGGETVRGTRYQRFSLQ